VQFEVRRSLAQGCMGPPAPKGGAIRMTKLCEIDGPHDVFGQSFFPLRESSSKKSAGSQTSNRPDAIQVWVSVFCGEVPERDSRSVHRFPSARVSRR
jgi:hypothetical protein